METTTPSSRASEEDTWQVAIEFTVAGETDSSPLIADKVAAALQPLRWPAADLHRCKQTVVDAARQVIERSRLPDSTVYTTIRVLTRAAGTKTQKIRRPRRGSDDQRLLEWSPYRGQGFFLVQKQVVSSQVPVGDTHYVIELFVY